MPLAFGADIIEGKVYRGKKKKDEDDEKQALKELQTILSKKNRRSCDCEAQIHDLIENCLSCGRLTCEFEGPGKCVSCGSIILDQNQRNRLSKYVDIVRTQPQTTANAISSTSQGRSRIIDQQFDLFSIDNKKHLRESEKKMLKSTLEDLQAKRYQRKMVFEMDIDNMEAGTRSVPMIDDYEAELRMLQLNENTGPIESNISLADLIAIESKKNYSFEYIEPEIVNRRHQSQSSNNNKQQQPTNMPATKIPNVNRQEKSNQFSKNKRNNNTETSKQKSKQQSAWNKNENQNNKNKDTRNKKR